MIRLLVMVMTLGTTNLCLRAQSSMAMPQDPLSMLPQADSAKLRGFVAGLIRQAIPEHYVNEKDWGHEKRIYAGVKLRREGWKLETKRRWKQVNHGAWNRYSIDLVEPEKNLKIKMHELAWGEDGMANFRVTISGSLHCFARRSRWNYGVQLWSFSVDADAVISITIAGRIALNFDYKNIPPDIIIAPEVHSAKIEAPYFEVNRISQVGGEFAEGIGDALETILRKEIIERQQVKLVSRINRQIARKEETLRFSMNDWLNDLLSTKPDPIDLVPNESK